MARGKMIGGVMGLAVVGGLAWWFLRRKRALPTVGMETLAQPGVQTAAPETLAGLKEQGAVPADAVDVFLVPLLQMPLAAVAGTPGSYAVPASLVAGGSSGLPAAMSGFGARPLTVQRATPSFDQPRPGSITLMTTPRMPSPRSLGSPAQFGCPVSWQAGQLYQGGTHETTSGVTGLWY
jgi:hypothetical protein